MDELEAVKIRKIGVMSFATTLAVINAIIGLILGIIFTILAIIGISLLSSTGLDIEQQGGQKWIAIAFGLGSIITFPILFGIAGFIQGVIGALVYNIASKITKGIQLHA